MEENAGAEAQFSNKDYETAGAQVKTSKEAFGADIVLKVRAPSTAEIGTTTTTILLLG